VIAESNESFPGQANSIEVTPESDFLPDGDPVTIDYLVDSGELTGPPTIAHHDTQWADWSGSYVLGDHKLWARATFSNGAIAWGWDVVEVHN
jgi:hypothetical protein